MGKLLAGAAKTDITPSQELLDRLSTVNPRSSFRGVYKHIYMRCAAFSDGKDTFFVFGCELGSFPAQRRFREKMQREFGVHPDAVMLGNTHNHQCVNAGDNDESPMPRKGPAPAEPSPMDLLNEELIGFFHDRALEAARAAMAALVPARMGFASGESHINASRDWATPIGGLQNSDYSGYSDRELPVIKVEDLEGRTIALLTNFGVHSNVMYSLRFNGGFPYLSGDLGGEIMEYVENALAGQGICIWTEAAAGDQNPLFTSFLFGCKALPDGSFVKTQQDMQAETALMLLEHMAQVQGLEILTTAKKIRTMTEDFDLRFGRVERQIPGVVNLRTRFGLVFAAGGDESGPVKMEVSREELEALEPMPADPVTFKFHLVLFNGFAFCGVNTEPYSWLGRLIKDTVPAAGAMVFAIDAGHVGYIPDVRKAEKLGFGTLDSHAESPWDTERAFYESFRDLGRRLEQKD